MFKETQFQFETQMFSNNDQINVLNVSTQGITVRSSHIIVRPHLTVLSVLRMLTSEHFTLRP